MRFVAFVIPSGGLESRLFHSQFVFFLLIPAHFACVLILSVKQREIKTAEEEVGQRSRGIYTEVLCHLLVTIFNCTDNMMIHHR